MPPRKALMLFPLKITQMVFPFVLTHSRGVRRLGTARACARPHEIAGIVVDVWSGIDVAVGSKEDVARGDEFGAEDLKVDDGRVEVGSLEE